MRREQLIDKVSEEFVKLPKFEITKIINFFLEQIKKSLIKKEVIELRGFGTFFVKVRKPKKARNPKTGKEVMLSERIVPIFKPGSLFKKMVREGNYFKVTKSKKSLKN